MYKVNIEKINLIDHISLPVLVVVKEDNSTDKILIGSEIPDASLEEITVLKKEVQYWLDNNVKGKYSIIRADIWFENEEEAVFFKTVWI